MRKVLLIGKDARSDCMADALGRAGAAVYTICDLPNHPGLARRSKLFRCGRTDDVGEVLAFAREVRPDLVVVGPEDPLANGVVDAIQAELGGVPCVGPTRALARLESSKSFTRRLLTTHRIAGNVAHRTFTRDDTPDDIEGYLRDLGAFVVKADGLMGGKGVKVFGDQLQSIDEALAYARSLLARGPIVVEEKVEGEEFSLQSLCDGRTVVDTIPVQDHKRALEGDRGPNTGGMGSYSCADHRLPFLTEAQVRAASSINRAVFAALQEEVGQPYHGILYGGFMATPDGVRVLEYNARFGDPEVMNVLPLLRGDFLELCWAIGAGQLDRVRVEFERRATVCKYVVPEGYPDAPVKDAVVRVGELPADGDDLRVYYAAVREEHGDIRLTGSRAIAVVAVADALATAGEMVEAAIGRVHGPVTHRRDIGTAELIQRRVQHMEQLRASMRACG